MMGRRSKMSQLLLAIEASDLARERMKVMLLTLGGGWSVKDGMERLSLSRTRFQLLRRRMLEGALVALEAGPTGRPRLAVSSESEAVVKLKARVSELTQEVKVLRTQLELSESPAGEAVRLRVTHLLEVWGRRRKR